MTEAAPINVLFLQKFSSLGGSQTFVLELIRNMDRSRFNLSLALLGETSPDAYRVLDEMGVRYYPDLMRIDPVAKLLAPVLDRFLSFYISHQGRRSPYDITAVFRLARILKKESIDVLCYIDKHAALVLAPLASLLVRRPALICSFHTPGLEFSALERRLYPLTQAAVATSRYHCDYLVETVGVSRETITVINNGIGKPRFSDHPDLSFKKEMGGGAPPRVAITVARLVPEKGLDVLLEGAAMVLKELPNTHFLIVGNGPLRSSLENLATRLNISDSVHFLGYRKDIFDLLAISDVFVLPSYAEFFPYAILEAMAVGVPIVSTRVGAIAEMIDQHSGILVQPGSPKELSVAICKLLIDKVFAEEISQKASERVDSVFSASHMTSCFERLVTAVYRKPVNTGFANKFTSLIRNALLL